MAKIVLINPRFATSFWSMTHSLAILDRQAMVPTAALSLLAALTPPEHEVRLLDEAVEPLDLAEIAQADIVGLTGMIVQRERLRDIARQAKALGKFLVVGGPWITVQEDYLQGLADKVTCGLIVGFDSDTPDIFDSHRRFLQQSGILHAMVGLLAAIPKTPLYERLRQAGRLDEHDNPAFGTNVIPLGMTREQLTRGFLELMRDIYEPDAYFDRLDDLYIRRRFYDYAESVRVPNIPRGRRVKYLLISLTFTTLLLVRLLRNVDGWALRRYYLKRLFGYLRSRPYPMRLLDYVMESACHYHFYRFSQDMAQGRTGIINTM
jgi:hypothetical protein